MSELVAFDDAARELETTTEGVAKLVSAGKLETAEEDGLLKVTRQSLDACKGESVLAPLEVSGEPEAEGPLPTISLAPEEEAEKVEEAPAPEAAGPETESIFGDEGFELETFEEVGAPAGAEAELAELEEAGEELEAEEVAELGAEAMPSARLQRMAVAAPVSTAATVMAVLTCIILLFAGLVTLSFVRGSPLDIVQSVNEPLLRAVGVEPFSAAGPAVRPAEPAPAVAPETPEQPAEGAAPEIPAPPAESATPETVADEFLAAFKRGDADAAKALMTEKARQAAEEHERFEVAGGGPDASYQVGSATVAGDTAEVPFTISEAGEDQQGKLRLRREAGQWRVYAMSMATGMPDMPELTIDFENPEATAQALGEVVGAALEEQLQTVVPGPAEEVGEGVQEPAESIEPTPSEEAEPTESVPSQE